MADIDRIYRPVLPKGVALTPAILPNPQEQEQGTPYTIEDANSQLTEQRNASGALLLYPFTFIDDSNGKEIKLPNSPLVRVEGFKEIKRTRVAGREGSVKELVSVNDWKVLIRGIAFKEKASASIVKEDGYPLSTLKTFVDLFKINNSLRVESKILEAYGISRVVVERFNVPATPGLQSAFYYELDCISDNDEEVVIIRNE